MPTVVSQGTLTDATFWSTWPRAGAIQLGDGRWQDYGSIYRTQANVRLVVDFLARNIAQLGLHVFRRVGETDRERLRDHALAQLLGRPNPWMTYYRLMYGTFIDFHVYGNAIWLLVRGERGRMAIVPIPPHIVRVEGGLSPTRYTINVSPTPLTDIPPEAVVHFKEHDPQNPLWGLSRLESLRSILAEEDAALRNRAGFWQHGGRPSFVIERPKDAPPWSPQVASQTMELFAEAMFSERVTRAPLLEDGMTLRELTVTAEQSQYVESRKLTREEVAAAYHVPPAMIGLLERATWANIREQHKQLYQDTLGPALAMAEGELLLQLLPEFTDRDGVYVEFNIAEKLQGNFEDQAEQLGKAIGRPWMTANEGRARLNLPAMAGNADELAVPVNVDPTGQGAGGNSEPNAAAVNAAKERIFARQRTAMERRQAWNEQRWNDELTTDLAKAGVAYPLAMAQAINEMHRAQLEAVTPNGVH